MIISILKIIISALIFITFLLAGAGWLFSASGHEGPALPNFDGTYFHNEIKKNNSLLTIFKWLIFRKPGLWPTSLENKKYAKPSPSINSNYRVTFINHATVLIQIAGYNIITDPIWAERCSPLSFAGPKRVRPPGLAFEDLPSINLVLISHNHYDHLDLSTLKRLDDRDSPQIIVGLGIKKFLEQNKINKVMELNWWEHSNFGEALKIWGVPAQHFSGRGLADRNKTLWMGFVIETARIKIYFAGDTGFGPHFNQIYQKFGAIDLAFLPIGAFLPISIMRHVHMQPSEALKAARVLHATNSIGIHFGTFPLADDDHDHPLKELEHAKKLSSHAVNFDTLDFGESREFFEIQD